MTLFLFKIVIAALVISFCSWLAGRRPDLAGFIIALPIASLIALVFSYAEYQNPVTSVNFAKSIFVGIPATLLFFIPFLLAEKFNLSFWECYLGGIGFLIAGFFIHKTILSII